MPLIIRRQQHDIKLTPFIGQEHVVFQVEDAEIPEDHQQRIPCHPSLNQEIPPTLLLLPVHQHYHHLTPSSLGHRLPHRSIETPQQ